MPSRWAALRGRYYVHLVQMHGPFPNLVRVGAPLFRAGLGTYVAFKMKAREEEEREGGEEKEEKEGEKGEGKRGEKRGGDF